MVELLVVVAIIALLAALLLPSLRLARARAKSAVCLSNQKQLAIAQFSLEADMTQFPPMFAYTPQAPFDAAFWMQLVGYGHIQNSTLVWCPATPSSTLDYYLKSVATTEARGIIGKDRLVAKTVNHAMYANYPTVYAVAGNGNGDTAWALRYGTIGGAIRWGGVDTQSPSGAEPVMSHNTRAPFSGARVLTPSATVMLSDTAEFPVPQGTQFQTAAAYTPGGWNEQGWPNVRANAANLVDNASHNFSVRHGLRNNAVFFDGHAELLDGRWVDKPAGDPDCLWDGY